jgi:TPR repeat protein
LFLIVTTDAYEGYLMLITQLLLTFILLALTVTPVYADDLLDGWEIPKSKSMKNRVKEKVLTWDEEFKKRQTKKLERSRKSMREEKRSERRMKEFESIISEDKKRREEKEKEYKRRLEKKEKEDKKDREIVEKEKKVFEKERRLAEQGDADAQAMIGNVYQYGKKIFSFKKTMIVVSIDFKEAIKWYKLSAAQGNAEAQYKLGEMYQHGHEVLQDFKEAIKWYKLSAEQGNVNGQFGLGEIYEILQKYTKSHKWYNIAGRKTEMARKQRDIVEKEMTPTQILKAQKLAKEWIEEHKKK